VTTSKEDKLRDKLRKLHALMGSENAAEREAARAKIMELLAKNKKNWNDLGELLSENGEGLKDDVKPAGKRSRAVPAPLDLISNMLQRHIYLTGAQHVALALWVAHTFVYRRFSITPRLALVSPVRGCGKSTVFSVANELAFKPNKVDNTTPAVLFRLIDREHACMLLDEVDNQDLPVNAAMRAVINSGHRSDGKVTRVQRGQTIVYSTFAPLALAAIGKLPCPVLHRSVVLHMERAPSSSNLTRFDPRTIPEQARMCHAVYSATFDWARQCKLDLDPPMPAELRNRAADNWRVLISIADATSPEWGEAARNAAVELSGGQDEDLCVRLLKDIRGVFGRRHGSDRISSAALVAELIELPEGLWSEWRGLRDDQTPRKLSPGGLALMLAPFKIRPRTIWPRVGTGEKSVKGYLQSQFEQAWASYCDEYGVRPSTSTNIRYLR